MVVLWESVVENFWLFWSMVSVDEASKTTGGAAEPPWIGGRRKLDVVHTLPRLDPGEIPARWAPFLFCFNFWFWLWLCCLGWNWGIWWPKMGRSEGGEENEGSPTPVGDRLPAAGLQRRQRRRDKGFHPCRWRGSLDPKKDPIGSNDPSGPFSGQWPILTSLGLVAHF